ncbi:transcriptional regulator, XRE family [Burkholderiales bacterium GJ-E10]|nr:transcriptional regulator, XRE family [Burkholderiales bacterium GJ-E10]
MGTRISASIRTSGQLGPILRQMRKAKGLSQAELGSLLGLSQERISAIESHPERVTLDQLLTVLMKLDAEIIVGSRSAGLPGKPFGPKAPW